MRIGMATTDFERDYGQALSAGEIISKIKDAGYDCVQFSFSSIAEAEYTPQPDFDIPPVISAAAVNAAMRACESKGIAVSSVNGTANLCSADKKVRAEAVRRVIALLPAAVALGSPIVTLCSGTRSRISMWTHHPGNRAPDAFADCVESMKAVAEAAERADITLAIETEASNIVDTPVVARAVLDAVGSPRLKMILDPANLFRAGEARRENVRARLDEAFAAFGADIVLAHGKDIREGDGIDFCAAGEGIVDFTYMAAKLREARYGGDMIVHGVYDESDMPRAFAYIDSIFNS